MSQVNARHVDKSGRGTFKYAPMSLAVVKVLGLESYSGEALRFDEVVFVNGNQSTCITSNDEDPAAR